MLGVKVPIGSGLDTKDNIHIRKGHAERGNLGISPIDDACNKTISLHLPIYHSRELRGERKGNSAWKLACDIAGGLVHMKIVFLRDHHVGEPWDS